MITRRPAMLLLGCDTVGLMLGIFLNELKKYRFIHYESLDFSLGCFSTAHRSD